MRPDSVRPLLTIAIPTYNRADHLAGLLAVLEPQLAALPQIELLISDNASSDATPEVIAALQRKMPSTGAEVSAYRHAEKTLVLMPTSSPATAARAGTSSGSAGMTTSSSPARSYRYSNTSKPPTASPPELDLVYATSYGFREDPVSEWQGDPMHRRFHTLCDARHFAMVVNIMFTFISGIIVNKARLESVPHEDPEAFLGTNLVQLSWSLPLLLHHRKSVVLWERPIAARVGNAHGYELGKVFGEQLATNVRRLLPNRPDLSDAILNFAIRRWLPSVVIDARTAGNEDLGLHDADTALRRAYGSNPRYWIFTWPALALPLPLAKLYTRATAALSKLIYIAHLPGFWRKQTS